MTTPSAATSGPPPLVLMHGGIVQFTVYVGDSPRAVQIWGPITTLELDSANGRVRSMRVSDARVHDGRLREIMLELDVLHDASASADYRAAVRKALDMLGELQLIDRPSAPADQHPSRDRFASDDPRE